MIFNKSIPVEKPSLKKQNIQNSDQLYFIGLKIREIREDRHLTREQLAKIAFCDASTIKRIENGSIETKISLLKCIADALQVNVTALMGLEYHEYPYMKEIIECYQKSDRKDFDDFISRVSSISDDYTQVDYLFEQLHRLHETILK